MSDVQKHTETPHDDQHTAGLPLFAGALAQHMLEPMTPPALRMPGGVDDPAPAPGLFAARYMTLAAQICRSIDPGQIDDMAQGLADVRARGGRLFILGVGGSAGNAGHAVNDFRKLCDVEAYAPTDNVSELTARTNDEGWESVFAEWLKISRASARDGVLVFSVGGGSRARNVSMNLVRALELAESRGLSIYAIVGKPDGCAAELADTAIVVPQVDDELVTPLSESFQGVIWHCLVSHPALKKNATKW